MEPIVPVPKNQDADQAPAKKAKAKEQQQQQQAAKQALELEIRPEYIQHRLAIFDEIARLRAEELASKPRDEISITLPDGSVKAGKAWETTPALVAGDISKSLLDRTIISKVDHVLWDLDRPLETSCRLEFVDFEQPEGKQVFWHSSAHILGEAAERRYGCHLCNGPPTTEPPGFYYDIANMTDAISDPDRLALEKLSSTIVKDQQRFERLIMSKDELKKMFGYSKYKLYFIDQRVPDGESSTVYRCGPFIDLCRGPHVRHTGKVKALSVLRVGSAYWLGNPDNESVQRVAGISFPDKKQMDEYRTFLAEAAKRNHRKIGTDQKLFFFDDASPGSCFFLPHGARIYNTLMELIRSEYRTRGYQEVITPNMYKADLWKTSGHWDNYSEDMFTFEVEKEKFGLKPMNCPGHCKIFAHSDVNYKDLPWRVADFGVLHRNEFSGALTGLTRVRRFCQDDAHIFCTQDQITQEIEGVFDFVKSVYGICGFTFSLKLSTRGEKYIGDLDVWDEAESQLRAALEKFTSRMGTTYGEKPGDAAFYGPKIDIQLFDALKREHQCGTIQLDFNLPRRFKLRYLASKDSTPPIGQDAGELPEGYARPVMIHRAVLGSIERMFSVLTEHFAGKWPFWLSPRQILVIPVMPVFNDYAEEIRSVFAGQNFYIDADLSTHTLQKKIRNGQLEQYNFIFVVGEQEANSRTVNVRNRDDTSKQAKGDLVPVDEAVKKLAKLREERRLDNNF